MNQKPQTIHQLSPAKINLMLRILGQRPDGYHLLQTYFQLLNWGDEIRFDTTLSDTITINGDFNGLAIEKNLIYQAIKLLEPYRTKNHGLNITVDKKIPQGSGLGGGSSNAGVTLTTVNQLWDCQRTQQQLQQMGLSLGADVPIFVANESAMAYGVGEQLQPYTLKKHYFILIFPPVSISTAEIFSERKLIRNNKKIAIENIKQQKFWTNTCLPIVLEKFPKVSEIYHQANQDSSTYMSGTGSTLFCCFESFDAARQFKQRCPQHWQTQLCESAIN